MRLSARAWVVQPMFGGVVYCLPVTHAQQPGEGSAQAGPRHGGARETMVLKALWGPRTRAEGPKAFWNSPGPGEQAWGVEVPKTAGPGWGSSVRAHSRCFFCCQPLIQASLWAPQTGSWGTRDASVPVLAFRSLQVDIEGSGC